MLTRTIAGTHVSSLLSAICRSTIDLISFSSSLIKFMIKQLLAKYYTILVPNRSFIVGTSIATLPIRSSKFKNGTNNIIIIGFSLTKKFLGFCLCNGTRLPSRGAFVFSFFIVFFFLFLGWQKSKSDKVSG